MGAKFLRVDKYLNVAVFDEGFGGVTQRTFCLNKESLKLRIENMERDNRDTSEEYWALKHLIDAEVSS